MDKLIVDYDGRFYQSLSTPNGMNAEVRKIDGSVVIKAFSGETAWMDSERCAQELDLKRIYS